MDVGFITLDLDLVFSRCHRFRFGLGQLFHDHHVMVIDAVGYVDQAVVEGILKSICTDGMIPGVRSIIRISGYMSKGDCILRISHGLIAKSHTIINVS